jgi:hypothetical protein
VLSRAVVGGEPWLEKARTVAKRLSGIAKDATPVLHGKDVFTKEDDATIVDVVGRIASATGDLTTEARVREGMSHAEDVAERLDAIFVRTPAGYDVKDVGSLNGTYVNRRSVDAATLRNGDEVQIGKYRFVYYTG